MGFDVGSESGDLRAATRQILNRQTPEPDELTAEWQAIDRIRHQAAGPLFRDVRQMFKAQRARAERLFEERKWQVPASMPERREGEGVVLTAERLFTISELTRDMQGTLTGLTEDEKGRLAEALGVDVDDLGEYLSSNNVQNLIRSGFETAVRRLDADTTFDPNDPEVREVMERLNNKARGIAKTTRDRLNSQIRTGIAENESVEDIQGRVLSELRRMAEGDRDPDTGIQQSRARRIASTTTTTAFERGQKSAFERTGMYGRMWLSQRDGFVRRGHVEADGQQRTVGEPFNVRGQLDRSKEELQYPGDPSGRASNVINCRCTALPIPDEATYLEMQQEEPDLSSLPQL